MSLYIIGHSFVRQSFTRRVVAKFSKVIGDAYSIVKVAGQGGLTVPRLRRQVRDIERFVACRYGGHRRVSTGDQRAAGRGSHAQRVSAPPN